MSKPDSARSSQESGGSEQPLIPTGNRVKWKELSSSQANLLTPSRASPMANGSAPRPTGGSIGGGGGGGMKNRTDSLSVPGAPLSNAGSDAADMNRDSPRSTSGRARAGSTSFDPMSRRSSSRSIESRLSTVDISRLQNAEHHANEESEEKTKGGPIQSDHLYIRSAIPYLPLWLATLCFTLNVIIPGVGTMLSGFSIFCCGKPRVQSKEGHVMTTFCINVLVGVMQLFTVTLMLVGWFWSLVWGIYLLILAIEHRKEEKARRERELQAKALIALNSNLRPWTLMRT